MKKAPTLPNQYDREFLQKVLDELYARSEPVAPSGNVTLTGSPSGKKYTLSVDDTTITSPTVVAKR